MSGNGERQLSLEEQIARSCAAHPPVDPQWTFPYGTSGFRSVASRLTHVMHRCGLLAALRSAHLQAAVGVCVTASHNLEIDNGAKLIDADGGMLVAKFEELAVELVASATPAETFLRFARSLWLPSCEKSLASIFTMAVVVVGRDGRVSSPRLLEAVKEGVRCVGGRVIDVGVVTTPQVHFAVKLYNDDMRDRGSSVGEIDGPSFEANAIQRYYEVYDRLVRALYDFINRQRQRTEVGSDSSSAKGASEVSRLVCDGANGVGAKAILGFRDTLKYVGVELEVRNDGSREGAALNQFAGAEYVQKELKLPEEFGIEAGDPPHLRCCALDGDADRLVYFSMGLTTGRCDANKSSLLLLDGDKIGVLYFTVITRMLDAISLKFPRRAAKPLSIGIVQTAYANGASTATYAALRRLSKAINEGDVQAELACVKTGVKHLHHKALEYTIGIYFESNGHGTVIFDREGLESWVSDKEGIQAEGSHSTEFEALMLYLELFNPTIGDAMTDILAVEMSLKYLEYTFTDWISLYTNFPCVQRKVPLSRALLDKLKPHPIHEKTLNEPSELQSDIEELAAEYPSESRAFIRPSGTEDVCRIYAEAPTEADAESLASAVITLLADWATAVNA